MITLHTNIVTKLVKKEDRPRFIRVLTPGTVVVRLGLSEDALSVSPNGFGINNSESVLVETPPYQALFGVAGTVTTVSIAEEPFEFKLAGINPIRLV